jgi:Major Facilitator Superfamily
VLICSSFSKSDHIACVLRLRSIVLITHPMCFGPHKQAHRLPRLVQYNEQMSTFFIYLCRETLWSRETLTSTTFRFVASVGIVPQWFSKRRSFANSIAAAGSGVGGLTYSLASQAMIQSIGLGWAFRVLAILAFVVNALCAITIRDRNRAIGSVQLAFDVSLFRRKEFLLLQLWGFFSMLGYIVLLFSLPNYARVIGLSAKQGSIIGAVLNLGQGKAFLGSFGNVEFLLIVDQALDDRWWAISVTHLVALIWLELVHFSLGYAVW